VSTKLYVGNLGYGVSSADLTQLFAQFGGVIKAAIVESRDTGRSKGFGFVEMASTQEAQAAIAGLHGVQHEGRALSVSEATPRAESAKTAGKHRSP
jgi:RNA recognition motif-containing protein